MQKRFCDLLSRIGIPQKQALGYWSKLDKLYSESHRAYHNWNHIEHMLDLFDHYREQLQSPMEVELAIFYHDAIYDPKKKDNEEQSALLAESDLSQSSLDSERVVAVRNLIRCTEKHLPDDHPDAKWLLDFDLAILGREEEVYVKYTKAIRKEYKMYPTLLYNQGRKKAMKKFLERERIFYTDEFFDRYESMARANIEREIG